MYTVFYLAAIKKKELNLNVLQFNVWQEGTIVEDGFEAIIDEIIHSESKYPILEQTDLVSAKNDKALLPIAIKNIYGVEV